MPAGRVDGDRTEGEHGLAAVAPLPGKSTCLPGALAFSSGRLDWYWSVAHACGSSAMALVTRFLCWHLQEQALGGLDANSAKPLPYLLQCPSAKGARHRLSITHNFGSDSGSQRDVGQAR